MAEHVKEGQPVRVNVHYTDSIADGKKFRDMVVSRFNCPDVYFTPYTPVMAGHTGPVIAVSFFP